MAADIVIIIGGDSTPLEKNLRDTLGRFVKQAGETGDEAGRTLSERINKQIGDAGKKFSGFNSIVTGVERLTGAFEAALAPGKEFQAGLADLQSLTGVSGPALDDLGQKARNMAKEFGGSATGNIEAFKGILSKLGPDIAKSPEALDKMARSVNTLSAATGDDAVKSMEALTTGLLQFGVSLDNPNAAANAMAEQMNIMAAAAKEGAAEVPDLSAAISVAGVAASGAHVSFAETSASLEILAQGGKKGAEAGTALRNVLGTLGQGRFIPKKSLEGLEEAGVDIKKLGDTTIPLTDRLRALGPAMNDTALITKFFGKENAAAAGILLRSVDGIDQLKGKIVGTNTAYEQAAIRQDTVTAKLERFKAQISDFAISAFQVVGDKVSFVVGAVNQIGPALAGVAGILPILTPLFSTLWTAATGPIGLIVLGVAAVGVALYELYQHVQPVRDAFDAVGGFISKVFETAMPAISAFGDVVVSVGKFLFDWLVFPFQVAWETGKILVDAIGDIIDALGLSGSSAKASSSFFDTLSSAVKTVAEWFGKAKDGVDNLRLVFPATLAVIKSFVSDAIGAVSDLVNLNFTGLTDRISNIFSKANQAANIAIKNTQVDQQSGARRDKDSQEWATYLQKIRDASKAHNAAMVEQATKAAGDYITRLRSVATSAERKKLADTFQSDLATASNEATAALATAAEKTVVPPPNIEKTKKAVTLSYKNLTNELEGLAKDQATRLRNASKLMAEESAQGPGDAFKIQTNDLREQAGIVSRDIATKIGGILDSLTKLKKNERVTLDLDLSGKIDPTEISVPVEKARQALQAALKGDLGAINTELNAQILKASGDFHDKLLSMFAKDRQDEINAELGLIKLKNQLLVGSDLDTLQQRGRLRLEELKLQQEAELNQAVDSIPEFQAAVQAALKNFPNANALEVRTVTSAVRADFVATNDFIRTMQRVQHADFAAAESQFQKEVTDNQVSRFRGVTAFVDGIRKGFDTPIDNKAERDRLEKEATDLKTKGQQIWQDYHDGKIATYEDYAKQIGDINKQIEANQQALADTTTNVWSRVNAVVASGFDALLQTQQNALPDILKSFEEQRIKMLDTATVTMDSFGDRMKLIGSELAQVGAGMLVTLGAVAGKAIGEGKDVGKAVGKIAFDTLQSLVPIFSAQILMGSLATPQSILTGGLLGIAEWSGLTLLITGAVAAARSALGFKKGGFVPGGEKLIRINEEGPEHVTNHLSTIVNRVELEWMDKNPGKHLRDLYEVDRGHIQTSTEMLHDVQRYERIVRLQIEHTAAMKDGHGEINKRLDKVVEHLGEVVEQVEGLRAEMPAGTHSTTAFEFTHEHKLNESALMETITKRKRGRVRG